MLLNLTKTNNIYLLLDIHLTAVLNVVVVYWCQVLVQPREAEVLQVLIPALYWERATWLVLSNCRGSQ